MFGHSANQFKDVFLFSNIVQEELTRTHTCPHNTSMQSAMFTIVIFPTDVWLNVLAFQAALGKMSGRKDVVAPSHLHCNVHPMNGSNSWSRIQNTALSW
jgi:hypothetical protein